MSELAKKYMGDLHTRTLTTNTISFFINGSITLGQLLLGFMQQSPWYIINAAYYLILCMTKGQALHEYKKMQQTDNDEEKQHLQIKIYRRGAVFICLMGFVYLGICIWMFQIGDVKIQSLYYIVYGTTAIAFTKIGLAIHGVIITRKINAPLISLFKKINFLDAMVSIVLTQCALLTMTGSESAILSSSLLGMGVSMIFIIVGIIMLKKKWCTIPTINNL